MANPIKLKRGNKATIGILDNGEPGWTTDTNELFVGTGVGNVKIGEGGGSGGTGSQTILCTTSTAVATVNKVITIPGYTLTAGDYLGVLFTNGNTAALSLAVNGGTAVPVRMGGGTPTAAAGTGGAYVSPGMRCYYHYDGTYMNQMGSNDITDDNPVVTEITNVHGAVANQFVCTPDTTYGGGFYHPFFGLRPDGTIEMVAYPASAVGAGTRVFTGNAIALKENIMFAFGAGTVQFSGGSVFASQLFSRYAAGTSNWRYAIGEYYNKAGSLTPNSTTADLVQTPMYVGGTQQGDYFIPKEFSLTLRNQGYVYKRFCYFTTAGNCYLTEYQPVFEYRDSAWVNRYEFSRDGLGGGGGTQGPPGPYFTPSVNATTGDISWTNNGGLSNPTTVNIKGPQGLKGDPGRDGEQGLAGTNGTNGATFTPAVSSEGDLSWSNNGGLQNPQTVNIRGPQGPPGGGEGGGFDDGLYYIDLEASLPDMLFNLGWANQTYYMLGMNTISDAVPFTGIVLPFAIDDNWIVEDVLVTMTGDYAGMPTFNRTKLSQLLTHQVMNVMADVDYGVGSSSFLNIPGFGMVFGGINFSDLSMLTQLEDDFSGSNLTLVIRTKPRNITMGDFANEYGT